MKQANIILLNKNGFLDYNYAAMSSYYHVVDLYISKDWLKLYAKSIPLCMVFLIILKRVAMQTKKEWTVIAPPRVTVM